MKALIDRLSAELTDRYNLYLETFLVDLLSADGFIELRAGFSLRKDHELRTLTVKAEATAATTGEARAAIVAAVFEEIERAVDEAISEGRENSN